MFRGALVRRKRWPEIVKWHMGAITCTDKIIANYIEDKFIPDLVLEILTKNRVHENLDLYSTENKLLFALRQTIFDQVLKNEVKNVMRLAQSKIIDEYLMKRDLKKYAEEKDPLSMAANSILNGVIAKHTKDVVRESMRYRVQDSILEA